MPGLTLGWEYLTGYAVATDPSSRERPEWPPHPGRVFMALAAAWFETGEDSAEGEALRWLEALGDPELHLPLLERVAERSNVTFYVPVNDKAGPSAATLQSLPAMTRNKKPRTFPRVHVGNAPCLMYWPEAADVDTHRDTLDQLCGRVTRIGHSSSLVRMWAEGNAEWGDLEGDRLVPDDQLADFQARTVSDGMLKMLADRFGEKERKRHAELSDQIDALTAAKKVIKGKGSRERKMAIDAEIEPLERQLSGIVTRPPIRPTLGLWTGYRRADATLNDSEVAQSHFDTDLLVLTQVAGPTLPLVSTLAVTQALRGAVMVHSGIQPAPPWVTGHQADGSPCDAEEGHLACIPLPFVGHKYADGHLLGVGLVFPRSMDRPERGSVLGALLMGADGLPRERELKLGRLGVWKVKKREWSERREALQPETWTAHPKGETVWASATPVVLDRFPKSDRIKDRAGWTDEVKGIIAEACKRIGLPEPADVDIDTTCWQRGCDRAVGKRRPLRQGTAARQGTASLGDGFPFYPAKGTNAPRPQVHVWLAFDRPVLGPILIGAGRYLGYGLCKPLIETRGAGR